MYVVIDACVLANYAVVDLLLTLAELGLISPRWSSQILEETYRTHTQKLHWEPRIARGFQAAVLAQFPTSLVSGYEKWIPHCTNHEKDRHVLACAIEAKARVILTYNLRDFASRDLAPWHTRALHPQDYLLGLHGQDHEQIADALERVVRNHSQKLGRKFTIQDELRALAPFVPEFSKALLAESNAVLR
ncbi:hypothetical protein AXK11_03205 [Cephaloticoccus primus]|uniref:PIN domain-containing protein n=1 Tax=Cephaloticoccus primus TaxID=1548207 RepID=A0A139SQJ3_9BACT|nr:hypothetical protein AXK11_03205 [Cephaloticoccus primus]